MRLRAAAEDDRLAALARLDVQASAALDPDVAAAFGLNAEEKIDGAREGHVVVRIRKGLQDFEGQLKPGSVKGGDIAPMPT